MDLPPVPASVAALVASGKLPPGVAAVFAEYGRSPFWDRTTDAVEEYLAGAVDEELRGAVALVGAYGYLAGLELLTSEPMTADNDRAEELLREADEHGIPDDETEPLRAYSSRMRDVAVDAAARERYIARYGASPRGRLDAKLEQANARYDAGDRAAALALYREVGEADIWGEFSGAGDRSDIGWCLLLRDATRYEGPEAVRRIWEQARASRRAARFPVPNLSCALVKMLSGAGVPDILRVLVEERVEASEPKYPGDQGWSLTDDERQVLLDALDEIERAGRA